MEIAAMEKARKRQFAFLCIGFCIPLLLGFTAVDYYEDDFIEAFINILMLIVLSVGFIAIRKWDADIIVYRLALLILAGIFIYNILIGSGHGTAVFWLFVFPLVFVFFLGKKEGGFVAILFFCALAVIFLDLLSLEIYIYYQGMGLRLLVSILLVTILAYSLESSREKYGFMLLEKHSKLLLEKQNLEEAIGQIKTLSGLIPICSHCKRIRDDHGFWQQVEIYVRDHSSAEFSHGICPECIGQYYEDDGELESGDST